MLTTTNIINNCLLFLFFDVRLPINQVLTGPATLNSENTGTKHLVMNQIFWDSWFTNGVVLTVVYISIILFGDWFAFV